MDITKLEEIALLTGFAKAVALNVGQNELGTRHFVAATRIAERKGLLTPFATLHAHVIAHASEIDAILAKERMSNYLDIENPADVTIKFNVEESLKTALGTASTDGEQLINPSISFVDSLLAQGRSLLARRSTAYHEAGHAIVSLVLRPEVRIPKVTIQAEGNAAGSTAYVMHSMTSYEDFQEALCVLMAGQVSQVCKFGPEEGADAGAQSDFAKATLWAWQFITAYGLDEDFGPVSLHALQSELKISEGYLFDEAQRRLQSILKSAMTKTTKLVKDNWPTIDMVANLLLANETINEDDIRRVTTMANA